MEGKDEPKKISEEPMKAKVALDLYLSMGVDRSIAKVAEQMGKASGYKRHLEDWSSRYKWVERARVYDEEQLERKRTERQKQIDEMNRRHIRLAIKQQENAIAAIEKLKNSKKGLGSIAAVNLLKLAIDIERLANDAATEQIALTGNKNADPVDVIVETFWGRGTDPRKRTEPVEEPAKEGNEMAESDDEGPEVSVEFGIDIPEDEEEG